MTTSTVIDADTIERQELLAKMQAHSIAVDPGTSLDGLRELWATFDPDSQLANAAIEPQRRNEEAEPPKRELETAPDEGEEQEEGAPKPDPEGKRLFDESDYEREDLAISKIDGNQVDRIAIKVSGEVFLDRSNPADVALYNKLRLGAETTLMVEGRCSATGAKGATDREGDLDVVVGQKSVKVTTIYIPAIAGAGE